MCLPASPSELFKELTFKGSSKRSSFLLNKSTWLMISGTLSSNWGQGHSLHLEIPQLFYLYLGKSATHQVAKALNQTNKKKKNKLVPTNYIPGRQGGVGPRIVFSVLWGTLLHTLWANTRCTQSAQRRGGISPLTSVNKTPRGTRMDC